MNDLTVSRVETFHETKIFLDSRLRLVHKHFGNSNELTVFARRLEEEVVFFVIDEQKIRFITGINPNLTAVLSDKPAPLDINNNPDGSFTFIYGDKFLSARKTGHFGFAPKNLAWEHFSLSVVKTLEKRNIILVLMNRAELGDVLSTLNLDAARIEMIVADGLDCPEIVIDDNKIPMYPFQRLNRLQLDKNQYLWLLGGWPQGDIGGLWNMVKFLMEEGVLKDNIINFTAHTYVHQYISRKWSGNVHYAENHHIDFFATGISTTEHGLDINCITDARGVNLALANQDLEQGYATARYVFEHRPSPPPPPMINS